MSDLSLVRPSRDGDQFHYVWAARRCLQLLPPRSDLVAISIEGSSMDETASGISDGEELIDIAEYFGSEDLDKATKVRYLQLKHSTRHPDDVWQPSGLKKTILGFAKRYSATRAFATEVEFVFLSNRPIESKILQTIQESANGTSASYPAVREKLLGFTELTEMEFRDFCRKLSLVGSQPNLWEQRGMFFEDLCQFQPGIDGSASIELKELVTRKACSDGAKDPSIRRVDVLRALKTNEGALYPAPCQIKMPESVIDREVIASLLTTITGAESRPVLIHAAGGVGKSVATLQLAKNVPDGSVSVVYDCFGNGGYRNPTKPRHRAQDGVVQIANELAGMELCYPLVPHHHSDSTDLLRACISRLKQAVDELRKRSPEALLYIFVDAVDNAEMAAADSGEDRSFARDLLRVAIPDGVRLVGICRSHRRRLLNPPPSYVDIELPPFSLEETEFHLRQRFSDASDHDAGEFHRLTCQNPRVQAIALSQDLPLEGVLRSLGPEPTNAEDTIQSLFEHAISALRDASGKSEGKDIDVICAGLSILRPLVPISVLAQIAGVTESAIASFASDLGHPLRHIGGHLQFTDEPAETWFRENFRPSGESLSQFIDVIRPLADCNTYVASVLPQLMLEAGQLEELVSMSLSGEALPVDSPIAKREIELNRLQWALKACLREQKLGDAAKLALKAGVETVGHSRLESLIRDNADLANLFLATERVEHYAAVGMADSAWYGSHYIYEACLLSYREELLGDARSRLRIAQDYLHSWNQLDAAAREREIVENVDVATFTMTVYNLSGADACVKEVRRWTPRRISYYTGKLIADRFIDCGKYDALDEIARSAGNDFFLVLAINLKLRGIQKVLPEGVLRRALPFLRSSLVELDIGDGWDRNNEQVAAVTAFVESLIRQRVSNSEVWIELLEKYLPNEPPRALVGHYQRDLSPLLKAYVLLAELKGEVLEIQDLAHPEIRLELDKEQAGGYSRDRSVCEFRSETSSLLPLLRAWAKALVQGVFPFEQKDHIPSLPRIEDDSFLWNKCVLLWLDVIAAQKEPDVDAVSTWNTWIQENGSTLFTDSMLSICRKSVRIAPFEQFSHQYITISRNSIERSRDDAGAKTDNMLKLSRAILPLDRHEAQVLFEASVDCASKFGDEVRDRWLAIRDLAEQSCYSEDQAPEVAYRLARAIEVIVEYCDESNFDWDGAVSSITHICPRTSLAVLSRWRDRAVGYPEQAIISQVNSLVELGHLSPITVLPMICIQSDWDECSMLERALVGCDQAEAECLIRFAFGYLRLQKQTLDKWKHFSSILEQSGLALPSIEAETRAYLASSANPSDRVGSRNRLSVRGQNTDESDYFEDVWAEVDVATPEGFNSAYKRFEQIRKERYCGPEGFYSGVFSRVGLGHEVDFLRSFADSGSVSFYELKYFFESLPDSWLERASIKRGLMELLRCIARRHCFSITRNRPYETFPLTAICSRIGLDVESIIDEALLSLGNSTDLASADRLFSLLGLIAPKLDADEANDALRLALQFVEEAARDEDGDGPWDESLLPLQTVEGCFAGYLWGSLGATKPSVRWQAAHIVRGLCRLGCVEVVLQLIEFVRDEALSAKFCDARFVFYQLHAHQYFMMALSRASIESPETVVHFRDFLLEEITTGQGHVMIRHFAAQALQSLMNVGLLDESFRELITSVNRSALPVVESKASDRIGRASDGWPETYEADGIYFGIDFEPYWFDPLGRCFAQRPQIVSAIAAKIINDDWKLGEYMKHLEDGRATLGLYRYPETSHSHGRYPKVDDLSFYLSYHAMMVAAGELLERVPLHKDTDDNYYDFSRWLSRHDLTRNDGKWLFDRRDPFPVLRPSWLHESDRTDDWRWCVQREDFDKVLFDEGDRLNLWGNWNWTDGYRDESYGVHSGLVTPDRSEALLRALQTATDPMDFYVADAGDYREVDSVGYQLVGWVKKREGDLRIDEYDPWGGKIDYPIPAPANYVQDRFDLSSDDEMRNWTLPEGDLSGECLWTQTWKRTVGVERDGAEEGGSRLQSSLPFVLALLREFDMDMIVEVQIRRRLLSRESSDHQYVPANSRLFLIRQSGKIVTL